MGTVLSGPNNPHRYDSKEWDIGDTLGPCVTVSPPTQSGPELGVRVCVCVCVCVYDSMFLSLTLTNPTYRYYYYHD